MSASRPPHGNDAFWSPPDPAELGRILFEETADAMFVADPQGRVLTANPRGAELTGYAPAELIGMDAAQLVAPEDRARLPVEIGSLESGASTLRELRILRKDGGVLPVEISARRLADGRLLGIARDVTDRRRAEEALRENMDLLASIFRAAPTGIGVVSGRKLLAVNDRLCEMTGYRHEELVGKSARILYPSDADFEFVGKEKYRQIGAQGTGTVETRWQRKDGRVIDVLMSSTPINPEDLSAGVTFTALDITERKRAEEEKERLQAQLLQAQKMESVGRLAGGVAHDFNNMLGVILGHTELSLMQVAPGDPLHGNLAEIRKAAQRSADLTRQLLAFARKQAVAPKVLDLNATVGGMLKMLRRLIGEDIDLDWRPGENLWPVRIDPAQLDQVLANLAVNARDAIAGVGKLTIETTNLVADEAYCAAHRGLAGGEYAVLAVRDTGCGMGDEVLPHIFEPFFTTKEVGRGTGLGLATVYGIVKQNDGYVTVSSAPGKGATFRIFLPRHAGQTAEGRPPKPSEPTRGRGETVLLVEDEAAILSLGKTILERLGYSVLAAGTPAEALRQAEAYSGEIHLLLTDLIMPEMNGRELSRRLKAIRPSMKCLFMSGYTASVIARHGIVEEGVQFLQKPFLLQELSDKVRQALERD